MKSTEPREGRFHGVRTPDRKKSALPTGSGRVGSPKPIKARCRRCRKFYYKNPNQAKHEYCSDNCRKRAYDERRIIRILIKALTELVEKYEGKA